MLFIKNKMRIPACIYFNILLAIKISFNAQSSYRCLSCSEPTITPMVKITILGKLFWWRHYHY